MTKEIKPSQPTLEEQIAAAQKLFTSYREEMQTQHERSIRLQELLIERLRTEGEIEVRTAELLSQLDLGSDELEDGGLIGL